MPSTFSHGIFPGAAVWVAKSGLPKLSRSQFLKFVFLASVLGNFPDLDLIPAFFFPEKWTLIHRPLGHNLFSLLLFAVIGGQILRAWVSRAFNPRVAFFLALTLVGSHLFLDSLGQFNPDTSAPDGVPLFWPFSDVCVRLPFALFPKIHAGNGHPILALASSKHFWTKALYQELIQCAFLVAVWGFFFHGMRGFQRLREARAAAAAPS